MIIGITGYIGVGKTTAAQILAKLTKQSFRIIDVDKLGHELLKDSEVKNNLIAEFGENILGRDLEIDRKKLGRIVFSNTELLQQLNNIMHSKIKNQLSEMLLKARAKNENVVVDIALLTELGVNDLCDFIILIKADVEFVYERMIKGYNKMQILNIMNAQKVQKYNHVVENNGDLDQFEHDLNDVFDGILNL
ncbi:dephospho-CoA kinase [Candidatus Woesearchaeota archaeon]|mgnify:CR=1 FL=1|jgi:dephospho-CoA kinase|nr:dephospho-CoA kinase [Candidatus Woesearchaeota archaeon]